MTAGYKQSGRLRDSVGTTLTPLCENPPTPTLFATAGSAVPNRETTFSDRSPICRTSTPRLKSSRTSVAASTGNEKDSCPYWNDFIAGISSRLWLPTETALPDSALSCWSGWLNETEARSWFSVERITALNRNSPRIYSPFSTPSVADYTDCAATKTQSKRIRVYPNREQEATIRLWMEASRWCFNQAVEVLSAPDPDGSWPKANWKAIKTAIIHSVPGRLEPVPYQIKSVAIRDACRAVSNSKKHYQKGNGWARVDFRRRKDPRQGCYIPKAAVRPAGAYHTILGNLHLAEDIPANHGDSRLTCQYGQYHLVVTHEAQRRVGETQARVVALDPGIRTFITWFSENDAGWMGRGAFNRIQRLCQHLDNLISKRATTPKRLRFKRRNLQRGIDALRLKIINLVDELHHQAAKYLIDNYDLILIPSFETQDMSRRAGRRIGRKSVRNLLTFSHYRFHQFLAWKAWQHGKAVAVVNEAYTSKTCSWSGEIIHNLGGRKSIRGSDGVRVERDINGARGIFLRALGDSPWLERLIQRASATNASSVC